MPEKEKLNCWDFKKCGLEIGGANSSILGVCPAACARNKLREKWRACLLGSKGDDV